MRLKYLIVIFGFTEIQCIKLQAQILRMKISKIYKSALTLIITLPECIYQFHHICPELTQFP